MKFKKKTRKKRKLFAVSGGRVGGRPGFKEPTRIKPTNIDPIQIFKDYDDIAKSFKDAHSAASKLAKGVGDKLKTGLNLTNTGSNFTISFNPSEYTNGGGSTIVPTSMSNTTKRLELSNSSDERHVHKTNFVTGSKPTPGVLAAKKVAGGATRVLTDSKIEMQTAEQRNIMTGSTGFNQKTYVIPPIGSQVPIAQIKDLIANDSNDAAEDYSTRKILSNVINVKQQFMIKNSGANLPIIFTIHLVRVKNADYSPTSFNSALTASFYGPGSDLNDFVVNEKGKVPKYLQHTEYVVEGSSFEQSVKVNVSNKLKSLAASSNFRGGFEIVESFTKTLNAGDYWNFSHTHFCGSGIDKTLIFRSTDINSSEGEDDLTTALVQDQVFMPFTYGIIFEAKGKQCEIYEIPETNNVSTYLGTSPCYFSYEYKTSAYFVPQVTDTLNVNTPSTRIFENETAITDFGTKVPTREKFILSDNITANFLSPTAGNVGKAYVPVQSSTINSYTKVEGGQDPG